MNVMDGTDLQKAQSAWTAMCRSQGVVEFELDGSVIWANDLFLQAVGYELHEVVGRHHRLFCSAAHVAAAEYEEFWECLRSGEFHAGLYRRERKDGRPIFLQATYNPVFDADGILRKVIKFATDVTAATLRNAEFSARVEAMDRSQAVAEFALDGTILSANANFLAVTGYELADIVGRHHRMFCESDYAGSHDYAGFRTRLREGSFDTGVYKRRRKGGEDVWLRATYNPVLDPDGRPLRIVKFAIDVTERRERNAEFEGRVAAIDRSQAVVEFDLEGRILDASANFLELFGYDASELVGSHHSALCHANDVVTPAYRTFWQRLGQGRFDSGRYRRRARDGRDVWIQATYNPILDAEGRPRKVVKIASDITREVELSLEVAARLREGERLQERLTSQKAALQATMSELEGVVLAIGGIASLPRFDKSVDDRAPLDSWPMSPEGCDLIIFEGWCVGARPQTADSLVVPVNDLERDEDADGTWRRGVNAALAGPYQDLFARSDLLVMLQPPSFDVVLDWRVEQERGLRARTGGGTGVMSDAQVARFVAHYERLTRHILDEMAGRADVTVVLDAARHVIG